MRAIKNALEAEPFPEKSPLLPLAPTVVAAFKISARRIHSVLQIPIKDTSPLKGSSLMTLQQDLKHVKYILIDEMSFSGRNLLQNIDKRLQQAFP